jgi:hypothetical protein
MVPISSQNSTKQKYGKLLHRNNALFVGKFYLHTYLHTPKGLRGKYVVFDNISLVLEIILLEGVPLSSEDEGQTSRSMAAKQQHLSIFS